MSIFSRMKKKEEQCGRLQDVLENSVDTSLLSSSQLAHLAACQACQAVADDVSSSRVVLRDLRPVAAEPSPWFAPRVMAAIAARESEWRQSLETWAAIPKLAARLTWVSALALLVASTWLYQVPKSTQPPKSGSDTVAESLFDSPQSSAPADDVVVPLETAQ
jgi:hypothetical protein